LFWCLPIVGGVEAGSKLFSGFFGLMSNILVVKLIILPSALQVKQTEEFSTEQNCSIIDGVLDIAPASISHPRKINGDKETLPLGLASCYGDAREQVLICERMTKANIFNMGGL
jgi:hypothetical protein